MARQAGLTVKEHPAQGIMGSARKRRGEHEDAVIDRKLQSRSLDVVIAVD